MNAPAVFRATYSDWKLVRTRKVVQIVFEVPVEAADAAYQVVGGMPDAGAEMWFAIARLKNEDATAPQQQGRAADQTRQPAQDNEEAGAEVENPAGRAKKSWHEMKGAQQAGVLCNDAAFQRFLSEGVNTDSNRMGGGRGWSRVVTNESEAAEAVRYLCVVNSRADLDKKRDNGDRWREIVSLYRAWVHAPEYVG